MLVAFKNVVSKFISVNNFRSIELLPIRAQMHSLQ